MNAELFDAAAALRALDQSYSKRGIVGCGAATGGSAWFDWHAHGLCRPEGYVRALPPPPRILGGCQNCGSCQCQYGSDDFCEMLAWWQMAQLGLLPRACGSARCGACGTQVLAPQLAPNPAPSGAAVPSTEESIRVAMSVESLDLFTFTPGVPVVWRIESAGSAVADSWLDCSQGFLRVHGIDELVASSARESGAWTIEVMIDHRASTEGFAPIITAGKRPDQSNFSLGVERDQLVLHLATEGTAADQLQWRAALAKLKPGRQHVLISYRPEELVCFVNGESAARRTDVSGSLASWTAAPVLLGSTDNSTRWNGRIGGVGLHPRFIGEASARKRFGFAAGLLTVDAR